MGKRSSITQRKRIDIEYALSVGWEYCGHNGKGHPQFTHPLTGYKLTLAGTASDYRGNRNAISKIKKVTPRED